MRKRYQKGSLQLRKKGGVWVWLGMWREGEHRRTKTLGQKSKMTKAEARTVLDGILAPLNAKQEPQAGTIHFGSFVRDMFYPFCRRKWKRSTRMTTEARINLYLSPELEDSELRTVGRTALHDLLDRKAASGLSFSVVAHLRCGIFVTFSAWLLQTDLSTGARLKCCSLRKAQSERKSA